MPVGMLKGYQPSLRTETNAFVCFKHVSNNRSDECICFCVCVCVKILVRWQTTADVYDFLHRYVVKNAKICQQLRSANKSTSLQSILQSF